MNSKECLEELLSMLNYEQVDECDKKGLLRTIKQDLDKLEKLEKAINLIKEYLTIANDVPLGTFAERCFTEEEQELLKKVLDDET